MAAPALAAAARAASGLEFEARNCCVAKEEPELLLSQSLNTPSTGVTGILRPLNIFASSAYRYWAKDASLNSVLRSIHLRHVQMPVVCAVPRLVTSVRNLTCGHTPTILNRVAPLVPSVLNLPVRTLTYCSARKGKRKTVKAVVYRFLRLHSGLWLRRKAGYKKKLWKKSPARKKRLREIVFCNKTQSKLLDKMTTSFWKRRNWYVDDPYQKYHDRTNLKV